MIKQYVVQQAYTDNDKVSKYIDGKLENYSIRSYWQTEGYCKALEEQGYSKAYDLAELREEIKVAKQEYEDALEFYNKVKEKALVGTEEGREQTMGLLFKTIGSEIYASYNGKEWFFYCDLLCS